MKKHRFALLAFAALCAFSGILTTACQIQEPDTSLKDYWFEGGRITGIYSNTKAAELDLPEFLYLGMRDIYYWNARVPNNLNPASFPTSDSLLRFTMVRPDDRFSAIIQDGVGYYNRLTMGTSSPIFGFASAWLGGGEVYISRVLGGSSADNAGMMRGQRIVSINGAPVPTDANAWTTMLNNLGATTTITVENADKTRETHNLMRTVFNERVVQNTRVFERGGKKIGYFAFSSFTQSAVGELESAFARFKSENIDELVLDLRYNGGGSVATAGSLCSFIASQLAGTPYVRLMYNKRYEPNNQTINMTAPQSGLRLSRLFVVITDRSASASELTINALRPYIDVKTVGSRSFGKPVGANIVIHAKSGYMLLPTSFAYTNALGQADFLNGFAPDISAADDVRRDFGDPEEASLRAALYFIQNGRPPALTKADRQLAATQPIIIDTEGLGRIPAVLTP